MYTEYNCNHLISRIQLFALKVKKGVGTYLSDHSAMYMLCSVVWSVIWCVFRLLRIYTVSKNVSPLTCYNLDIHDPIEIIFDRSVTDKVGNQTVLCFPPHLSSASTLPCETGNPDDNALVLCAYNTVQLLQRSRLPFSWTMPHKSPKLNTLITRFRESYTAAWRWVVSQKLDWRNQAACGWVLAMHWYNEWKMQF